MREAGQAGLAGRAGRLTLIAVLVAALGNTGGLAAVACGSVRQVDFKSLVYPVSEPRFTNGKTLKLKVSDGRYEEPHTAMSFFYLDVREVLFGRLTHSRAEDAAVVARYGSTTGNFYVTDTYVFSCVGGAPKLRAILTQDYIQNDTGVQLRASVDNPLKIRDGLIEITYERNWTPATPGGPTTFRYKLVGEMWQRQGTPLIR
jgi:hypothetical protein